MDASKTATPPAEPFPSSFWSANVIELFERAAYYSMASFVVIYLGRLGLGDYWPSTLNGILWFLVYFLPILSGTIADQIGFRRALMLACLLLVCGYFLMGYPVWMGGNELSALVGKEVTAGTSVVVPVVLALLFIGVGGSFVKPCIAGTVQRKVPKGGVDAELERVTAELVRGSPEAQRRTKEFIWSCEDASLRAGIESAVHSISVGLHSAEARDGIGAFLEKRLPRWMPA